MVQSFNYTSNVKDLQNRLIAQSIRESSNFEILTSEEAVKAVIQSYADRFRAATGALTDIAKYIVESKSIITKEQFNDLFESISIDLRVLYEDLHLVEQVLDLNLERNKAFYLVLKKRIRDLWNRLFATRLNMHDSNPSDESFYESFSTSVNSNLLKNLVIDKKTGYMYLEPVYSKVYNESHHLTSVSSITYPEPNDEGGVFSVTNALNTFEDNYKNGSKDLLKNGLWKEELLTNEIPDLIVNVGDSTQTIYKNFKGIVSVIDINYRYPVQINRLDLDLFGEYPLSVNGILYKTEDTDTWKVLKFKKDFLDETTSIDPVRGINFDILGFFNIEETTVKTLRLILNQEHYQFVDSSALGESAVDKKIEKDLSERRYELIKFGSNIDNLLSKPVEDENASLYARIMDIVESTTSVSVILDKIEELLVPSSRILSYDFSRVSKFEIGLWSVEPKIEKYTQNIGIYDSKEYILTDRPLISASILTQQVTPNASTVNWFISNGSYNIPIMDNNSGLRKEPINVIDFKKDPTLGKWYPGTFIALDFPIDLSRASLIKLSQDGGEFVSLTNSSVVFLSSRLLFLSKVTNPFRSNFVIEYPVSDHKIVMMYGLQVKSYFQFADNINLGIIGSNKKILEKFLSETRYVGMSSSDNLSNYFSVVPSYSIKEEAESWLGIRFNKSIFIASELYSKLDQDSVRFEGIIAKDNCKLYSSRETLNSFLNGVEIGYSTLGSTSLISNASTCLPMRLI